MTKSFRPTLLRFALLAGTLLSLACNESFSPRGPYEQRWVVFSILTTQSDTQFVRVYSNFNPPEDNPLAAATEDPDTAAVVTISNGAQSMTLHDTLLLPSPGTGLTAPVHAFVTTLFRPKPAGTYTLTVTTSSQVTASAQTTVPAAEIMDVPERYKLYQPGAFMNESIDVVDLLAPQSKGYLFRFLVEFGLRSDSTFRAEVEVPLSFNPGSGGTAVPVYQPLQRVTYTSGGASYPVPVYVQVLTNILNKYGTDVVFKRARFYCIQVDPNLYNYYNIANGFQDAYSTRTDQPDFTNIRNGLGVFGSFNVDSISYDLNPGITLPQQRP